MKVDLGTVEAHAIENDKQYFDKHVIILYSQTSFIIQVFSSTAEEVSATIPTTMSTEALATKLTILLNSFTTIQLEYQIKSFLWIHDFGVKYKFL